MKFSSYTKFSCLDDQYDWFELTLTIFGKRLGQMLQQIAPKPQNEAIMYQFLRKNAT